MHLKDIAEWDLAYLKGLPADEFDWLDFKDSRWLDVSSKCLNKLSTYVSAFANYDGGYLVIGIRDPKPGLPLELDQGVPLNIKKDLKSWLEDIIPNLTDPPVQRLNVHVITDPEGQCPIAGNAIVILHIPRSDAAPHQARDRKYYTRTGTKLNAIGHQAVVDILNRKQHPVVQTEVFVNFDRSVQGAHHIFWRVTNLSNVFARYVMTRIEIPINIQGKSIKFDGMTKRILNDGKTYVWSLTGSNHLAQPLFPHGSVSKKFDFETDHLTSGLQTLPHIHFQTFADQMEPIKGTIALEDAVNLTRKPPKRSSPRGVVVQNATIE